MGRRVTTLVVTVDGDVETEVLGQVLVVTEPKHVGVVANEIEVLVNSSEVSSWLVDVAVDAGRQGREAGDEGQAVLKGVSPVVSLLHALLVVGLESAVVVESTDTDSHLGHGVEGGWEAVRIKFSVVTVDESIK